MQPWERWIFPGVKEPSWLARPTYRGSPVDVFPAKTAPSGTWPLELPTQVNPVPQRTWERIELKIYSNSTFFVPQSLAWRFQCHCMEHSKHFSMEEPLLATGRLREMLGLRIWGCHRYRFPHKLGSFKFFKFVNSQKCSGNLTSILGKSLMNARVNPIMT